MFSWLTLIELGLKLVGVLTGITGWFHNQAQQQIGADKQTLAVQKMTIQTLNDALSVHRTATQAQVDQRLKDGSA